MKSDPGRWLALGLVWIAGANALLYSSNIAGALVQADSWYFLDTFIRDYLSGSLKPASFFEYRGGSDHVQPLLRLILLFHLHYFQLDFRLEGVIGAAFAVVSALVLWRVFDAEFEGPGLLRALMGAAVGALVLSLNSTNLFTWSLVTLGFVSLCLLVFTMIAAWRVCDSGKGILLLSLASLATLAASDKFALIGFIVTGASLLFVLRNDPLRLRRAGLVLAVLAGLTLLWLGIISLMAPATSVVESAANAATRPGLSDLARALVGVLSSSLIHRAHFGESHPSHVFMVVGGLLAVLHIAFWLTFAVRDHVPSRCAYVAAALMLLAYATVAGVIVGRSREFSLDYLQQPRYVIYYQLMNVALVLRFGTFCFARRDAPVSPLARLTGKLVIVITIGLVAVQPPLSWKAWDLNKYVSEYQQQAALQLGALADDPTRIPSNCKDILVVCGLELEKRKDLIDLLRDNKLNVFSRRFQLVHRLYPDLDSVPRTK